MGITLVHPMKETAPQGAAAAPRLDDLRGAAVALLDISKPGGSIFLDRIEHLLKERHGVSTVIRAMKPTFAKPAPAGVIEQIRQANAMIEALAD